MKKPTKPLFLWQNVVTGKTRESITQPSPNFKAIKVAGRGAG